MTLELTGVTRAALTNAMLNVEPHIRALMVAVRDYRVGFLFVPQDATPFRLPRRGDRPAIALIGDDFDCAMGPDAFHMPSVRRIIRACHAFAVVSSAPPIDVYTTMAAAVAVTRKSCLLVETRPEQEIQWVQLIGKLAPGRPICLSTVEGSRQ